MGLEGAVHLGFKKELAGAASAQERDALFDSLVDAAYQRGQATEAAAFLEIDAVIDPADTRAVNFFMNAKQTFVCWKTQISIYVYGYRCLSFPKSGV